MQQEPDGRFLQFHSAIIGQILNGFLRQFWAINLLLSKIRSDCLNQFAILLNLILDKGEDELLLLGLFTHLAPGTVTLA